MPTVPTVWISFCVGIFDVERFLSREEDHSIAGKGRFDGLNRHVASDEQGKHHVRKDDDISDGQQRELTGHFNVLGRLNFLFVWVCHVPACSLSMEVAG